MNQNPIDKLKIESYLPLRDPWIEYLNDRIWHQNDVDHQRDNQFWRYYRLDSPCIFTLHTDPVKAFRRNRSGLQQVANPTTRIELNPAKQNLTASFLHDLFEDMYGSIEGLFVRRIDVKYDDPQHFKFWSRRVALQGAKSFRWGDQKKRTTFYLGGKTSNQLVIYDKRAEIQAKEKRDVGTLTRLEMRLLFSPTSLPMMEFFSGTFEAFDRVRVYDITRLRPKIPAENKVLRSLQRTALVAALRKLPPGTSDSIKHRIFDPTATQTLLEDVQISLDGYFSDVQIYPTDERME